MILIKRFYYAPKVYAFIRSSNMDGKIYDISDDIVSGSVTRNLNALSTAELVVRNRFRKYLADPKTTKSIFLPMDMITIWLQRVAGHPIQVFTGYLDSVPYFQLYPGNCSIRASCTLKRLGIQRFDPGLEFFTSWVDHLGSWYIDKNTGEAYRTDRFQATDANAGFKTPVDVNDGGFAQLIYEFMIEVAGWKQDNVLVDTMPTDLQERAASLYSDINREVEVDLKSLEQTMGQIMGISWSPTNGVNADGTLTSGIENTIGKVRTQASKYSIPLNVMLVAGLCLTGFNARQSLTEDANPDHWGYGLYAARINDPESGETYRGFTAEELQSPANAAEAFAKDLIAVDQTSERSVVGRYSRQARKGDAKSIQAWIEKASGHKINKQIFANNVVIANRWTTTWNTEHSQTNSTVKSTAIKSPVSIKHLTWTSSEVVGFIKTPEEKKQYQSGYQNKAIKETAPIFWYAKKNFRGVTLLSGNAKEQLKLQFNSGKDASDFRNHLLKVDPNNKTFDSVSLDPTRSSVVSIVSHAGAAYPNWDGQTPEPLATDSQNPEPTDTSDIASKGLTFQQLGTLSLDSAFISQFAFPTSYIEAHKLTGDKSLLNDVPCLDAVQQFSQASLRMFQSLPDGRFLSFYPDYFGASGRGPNWWIHDIEVTNMGIQLNDDSLATHVYVVGDTYGLDGQVDTFDRITSRGVVTVAQAMMLESFIVPIDEYRRKRNKTEESSFGRLKDAYDLLQHYGARVYKEEQPLIRNSFFEFLYAWQRFMQKWSEQFATEVTFTFQPEILCGMILGFADHNLQMFVQSVTHTFDYASGFNTTCTLTSPAAVKDDGKGVGRLPGFAIAGNVNTFGATE